MSKDHEQNIYLAFAIPKSSELYSMLMEDAKNSGIPRKNLSSLVITRMSDYYRMKKQEGGSTDVHIPTEQL